MHRLTESDFRFDVHFEDDGHDVISRTKVLPSGESTQQRILATNRRGQIIFSAYRLTQLGAKCQFFRMSNMSNTSNLSNTTLAFPLLLSERQHSSTRMLSYRKDDRSMRLWVPWKFAGALTTPTATFPKILLGFCSI